MDIVKNNLTNLIPIVNPALKIENGIKLAIMYRILPTTEIDSSELVREAYKKLYGENLSLIHISEPTRPCLSSRMPSSA